MTASVSESVATAFRTIWAAADRPAKVRLFISGTLILVASILTGVSPLFLKHLTDGLVEGTWTTLAVAPIALVAGYVGAQWLGRALREIQTVIFGRGEQHIVRGLSRRLFMQVLYLPYRFHAKRQTGSLNQLITSGLTGYQLLLQQSVFSILPALFEISTIAIVAINFLDLPLSVILAATAVAYSIAFLFGSRSVVSASQKIVSAQMGANGIMTDSILNYETIKYYNAENRADSRYSAALGATEQSWVNFYKCKAITGLWVALIFGISLAMATTYSIWSVVNGVMTVGDFVLINAYLLQIIRPLELFGVSIRDAAQGLAFIDRLKEINRYNTNSSSTTALTARPQIAEIEFNGVSFGYESDQPVVKNISFTVRKGQTLAIVGPSGAGKSTTLKLLLRFVHQDDGQILINGIDMSSASAGAIRAAIAIVPQDVVLFNDTLEENIRVGDPTATNSELMNAVRLASLDGFVNSLPNGLDTPVGERGALLSGGEKQRVAIARAILRNADVFVFDEATSSLDSTTELCARRNIEALTNDAITIVIAHRLRTIRHADEIIVMDNGIIAERGEHQALLAMNGRYAAMWRDQEDQSGKTIISASFAQ